MFLSRCESGQCVVWNCDIGVAKGYAAGIIGFLEGVGPVSKTFGVMSLHGTAPSAMVDVKEKDSILLFHIYQHNNLVAEDGDSSDARVTLVAKKTCEILRQAMLPVWLDYDFPFYGPLEVMEHSIEDIFEELHALMCEQRRILVELWSFQIRSIVE